MPFSQSDHEWNTGLFLNSTVFWDITPCSPLKVSRSFGGTYHLNLQGGSARHLLSRLFLSWFFLRPWRWRRYIPPKRRLTFIGLHDVISQKMVLFTTTAVRTSDPAGLLWCVVEYKKWAYTRNQTFNMLSWHRAIRVVRHLVISFASRRTM
jgi:hypothetical protein